MLMFIRLSGSQSTSTFQLIIWEKKNERFKINLSSDNGKGTVESISNMNTIKHLNAYYCVPGLIICAIMFYIIDSHNTF